MPGIKGFLFKIWDPIGTIKDHINSWNPIDINSESDAENSLCLYLREHLDNILVRKQFPYDRIKADILVEDCVAIEIKFNLTTTTEFQRLIGQLETYARWRKDIIVLVVGDLDSDLKFRIEKRLEKDWDNNDYCFINKPLS